MCSRSSNMAEEVAGEAARCSSLPAASQLPLLYHLLKTTGAHHRLDAQTERLRSPKSCYCSGQPTRGKKKKIVVIQPTNSRLKNDAKHPMESTVSSREVLDQISLEAAASLPNQPQLSFQQRFSQWLLMTPGETAPPPAQQSPNQQTVPHLHPAPLQKGLYRRTAVQN